MVNIEIVNKVHQKYWPQILWNLELSCTDHGWISAHFLSEHWPDLLGCCALSAYPNLILPFFSNSPVFSSHTIKGTYVQG